MKKIILHFLVVCCAIQTFAQQPVTIQLTEKDGLPDIEFYDVLEDKNGFIWLAADKGLFRYDGKSFVNFSHQNKRGLSVFGLFEDDKGRIWCNTISGQFFYIENQKMILFADLKEDLKGQLPEFKVINNELIAFSEKGIFVINVASKKQKVIRDQISSSPYYGYPFYYKNQLFFTFENQIKIFEKQQIHSKFIFTNNKFISKHNAFCNLGNGILFCTNMQNKQYFFIKLDNQNTFVKCEVPIEFANKKIINCIKSDNLLWFGTNQGVIVCTILNNQITYKDTYLKSEYVSKIIKDKNNNYWFSTLRNGVFVMPNIYIQKENFNGISNQISALCAIASKFLIAGSTDGKISIWNAKINHWKQFALPSNSKVAQIVYNSSYKSIFISQDNQSYIWNIDKNEMYKVPFFISSKSISITANNELLNASYDRATVMKNPFENTINSLNSVFVQVPQFVEKSISNTKTDIRNKRAYASFYSFNNKTNYVGFVDELMRFDTNNKLFPIRYQNKPILAIDIQETNNEIIWVATFNDGIIGIKNNKVVAVLTSKNGLFSNQISKLKSNQNELWIATNKGVQCFNSDTKTFKNLTKNDGLESYTISDIEIINQTLFLSSNTGIYSIDIAKGFKNEPQPKVYFKSVTIHEKDTLLNSKYELEYYKNDIKFSFNANGFQSNESITYQYKLQGINDNWLTLENGNDFVRYSSLPSGSYTFYVKAINANGLASLPISIFMEVNAPYWQKWWFYVVLSLVISGGIWFVFKMRLKQVEKEKEIELEKVQLDKELISSQLENLRSQMNPHFIFNALNSIQEYIVTNEKVNASSFLVKFSRLIRMYLEHSRENEIPLEEEITALKLYLELEKDRFEEALDYEIIVDENLNPKTIKITSIFIQPYVENAIKHGLLHLKNNRLLQVTFEFNTTKDSVICSIKDNGIGRKKAEEMKKQREYLHKSFATSANQKRIELINKIRTKKASISITDLYDKNNVATGTLVQIEIPL